MLSGLFHLYSLDQPSRRSVWLVYIITIFFIEIPVFKCRLDPVQMLPSAASDLSLHGLLMSLLWVLGINGLTLTSCVLWKNYHIYPKYLETRT